MFHNCVMKFMKHTMKDFITLQRRRLAASRRFRFIKCSLTNYIISPRWHSSVSPAPLCKHCRDITFSCALRFIKKLYIQLRSRVLCGINRHFQSTISKRWTSVLVSLRTHWTVLIHHWTSTHYSCSSYKILWTWKTFINFYTPLMSTLYVSDCRRAQWVYALSIL